MFLLVETCRKYLKGGFWRSCKQRWHHYPTLIRAWISEWMYQFTGNSQVTLWVSVWILNVSICLKMLPPWPHQNRIIIKSSAQILFLIKKGNAKECLKYCTIALISNASKVTLKILQARLHQYMNHELPDVQAGFRKGRDQTANIHWIIEKTSEFQKNIYFCFIDYTKAFDCVDHNKLWKILQEMGNTRPPDLPPEKSVCRSGNNS